MDRDDIEGGTDNGSVAIARPTQVKPLKFSVQWLNCFSLLLFFSFIFAFFSVWLSLFSLSILIFFPFRVEI